MQTDPKKSGCEAFKSICQFRISFRFLTPTSYPRSVSQFIPIRIERKSEELLKSPFTTTEQSLRLVRKSSSGLQMRRSPSLQLDQSMTVSTSSTLDKTVILNHPSTPTLRVHKVKTLQPQNLQRQGRSTGNTLDDNSLESANLKPHFKTNDGLGGLRRNPRSFCYMIEEKDSEDENTLERIDSGPIHAGSVRPEHSQIELRVDTY